MGFIRDTLSKGVDIFREEILPLRNDLLKAGIIKPDKSAYDLKASLVDPLSYGNTSFGYKEKYSILDYSKCRQITYADPIVSAVIQTRLNQVASFAYPQHDKYKVGFKIKLRDSEKEPSKQDKVKIKEITQFILSCGVPENFDDTPELKRRDSFETFIRKVTRDSLTFDQLNFEITPRNDGRPYAFTAVDASTIKIVPDLKEQVERMGGAEPKSLLNIMPYAGESREFKQFKPKNPRYVQVINGVVRHQFDEWEMAFGVRNPRTDIYAAGYGYSEIEMLVTTITSHMNAETYNRKFFSQGSSVKGILSFEGNVPPDQLEAFRRQWYQQVSGINNAWRTPIVALGKDSKLNWASLHSTNREMEFGKWLEYCIKTICGVFQIDPIEIGFDISRQGSSQGSSTGGLGNGNQAERVSFSQDKGLRPLLLHIQQLMNDYVVRRLDPSFEFEFVGLNVNSEKDDLDKAIQQTKTFKTINETRAEHDMDPLPDFSKIKNPGDVVLDASLIQFITQQMQSQQQPEMGADGQMGGDPSQMSDQMSDQSGDQQSQEPQEDEDYESKLQNMTDEELEQERNRLMAQKSMTTRFVKELKI